MRKFVTLLVILSMILAAFPAMAEMEYLGDMEVVNCNEWVSLREKPSTSAKRVMKLYLGTVVNNCLQYDDEWIYVEYGGVVGYILSQYLQPCAEETYPFTMMITITPEDAPLYDTVYGEEPVAYLPANTIVRNCSFADNDRFYVEQGSRSGYINMMHAEVYNEMLHFPLNITLYEALSGGSAVRGELPLEIMDVSEYPIKDYDYNIYEYDDFMEADSEDIPKVKFVLYSDAELSHVHLFSVEMVTWDEESDAFVYEATLEDIQYQLDPEHPLCVGAVIWGDMPNLAVGFADEQGVYHFAFIEISGKDGSLVLREF